MKCKYISLSLYINENKISMDVICVLGVLEVGFSK